MTMRMTSTKRIWGWPSGLVVLVLALLAWLVKVPEREIN